MPEHIKSVVVVSYFAVFTVCITTCTANQKCFDVGTNKTSSSFTVHFLGPCGSNMFF